MFLGLESGTHPFIGLITTLLEKAPVKSPVILLMDSSMASSSVEGVMYPCRIKNLKKNLGPIF